MNQPRTQIQKIRDLFLVGARTGAFAGANITLLQGLKFARRTSTPDEKHAEIHRWARRWGHAALDIYGIKVDAAGPHLERGRPYPGTSANERGRVFVMNHRSGMDIPITYAFTVGHMVSRADVEHWPLLGPFAVNVETIFVDRSSKTSGENAVRAMTQVLMDGCGVTIYPEGTVFGGDEVRPFRLGGFKAAVLANAEVIPLGVAYEDNDNTTFGNESLAEHWIRVGAMRELRAAVTAGEPISGMTNVDELSAITHARVQQLVFASRRRLEGSKS